MPALLRAIGATEPAYMELELIIPFLGHSVPLRIYRDTRGRRNPCLIYMHGGFFDSGRIEDADAIARAIKESATVITVGYPLAPIAVFPAAVETGFSVLQWAAYNARVLQIDPLRMFVGGDQAGGTLAAAVAMVARDRQFNHVRNPQLAGQILITPLLDPAQGTAAMRDAGQHPCQRAWASYLPKPGDYHHPYASPLRSRRLAKLASTLLITTESDPMRDEANLYASNLIQANVDVSVHRLGKRSVSPATANDEGFSTTVEALKGFMSANRMPG